MKIYRKSIMASTGNKIPYDLVSMLVVLRDWADVGDDAYVSPEHKLLVDIADTLYNVGFSVADSMSGEYKDLYKKYGKSYFQKVLNDVNALDSQVSRNNLDTLITDYTNRATELGY